MPGREGSTGKGPEVRRKPGVCRHTKGACEVAPAAMLSGLWGKDRGRGFT